MKKCAFFVFLIMTVLCVYAEPVATVVGQAVIEEKSSAQPQPGGPGTISKQSVVTRIDMQLGDNIIHSNVLDYTLPGQLSEVADKCVSEGLQACFFLYKTYENAADTAVAAQANAELAVLSLQRGQIKEALHYIERAGQLLPEDPFIALTRGWLLFADGKYKKARQAFADMLYLTADFEYASSAKLGTALAYYFEGNKKAAAKDFQYIYTSNPYLISFAAYMMGQIAAQDKNSRKLAPVFLEQALSHDSHNYPALELLAKLSEQDKKKPLASFQYYSTLFSLDPTNTTAQKKMMQYAEKLNKKPEDYLFYLRLDQPIVQERRVPSSDKVAMALYADRWQNPVALTSVSVMPAGIMTVQDERLGEVLKSPSFVTRILDFNEETKSVDIKDARGHIEFSTRRPFVLSPDKSEKTILVKNARAADIFAADFSDKELTGQLQVIPTDTGMLLINQTEIEDLIPGLLATQAQHIKEEPALRALAVVFRAALKEALSRPTDKPYQITDNDIYFKFKGINLTVQAQLEAAEQSRGLELSGTNLGYYASCGVVSYDQIANTEHRPEYQYSPVNLVKYMLSNPPQDLYAFPADPTQWSAIKWAYLYQAKDIETRLNARTRFGKLRAIETVNVSPMGRVINLRFVGSKGEYITDNEQETSYILSAGTIRSGFFDLLPMYKGKNITRVLARGYDTGTGVGLCVAGADGLARQARDYQAIIKYYFPNARILDIQTGALH
jgi:SpoIID/LytB domain protein